MQRSHSFGTTPWAAVVSLLSLALGACESIEAAEIRYTEYGIAHIRADDYTSLGFGQGYAQARDNLCKIELGMLAFRAELSRHFGPDAASSTLASTPSSLASDLYFQGINSSGVIEDLLRKPAPLGPRSEVRQLVEGYVHGFNAWLEQAPRVECSDAAWLRPMTELDVYRRVYAVTLLMGQGIFGAAGIASAEPPRMSSARANPTATERDHLLAQAQQWAHTSALPGSNAVAISGDATSTGGGLNVANPHLSWDMDMRWWQAHLTVPGEMDVMGATLIGLPLVVMGHTATAAWSITTAERARRFTLFELQLVDGSATDYLVDGHAEAMERRSVTVQVKQADGSLEAVSHDQWWTRFGPVVGADFLLGLPPWSAGAGDEPGRAYVFRDANATNMRMLNTLFALDHARSADDVVNAVRETQGVPWWTVIAADAEGAAVLSQIHVVPNVSDAHAADCNTELGSALFGAEGIAVLDGSRSACDWQTADDAIEPGIMGPGTRNNPNMPLLSSKRYVENSNDSHWMPNDRERISGMPRILGDETLPRRMRTRDVMKEVADQLAKGPFTREAMQALVLSHRSYAAELVVDDVVEACRGYEAGLATSSDSQQVDVAQACEALARWDRHMDIDSRGALLFDRFWRRVNDAAGGDDSKLWKVAFDPADPVNTPNTLAATEPLIAHAFADAVLELSQAGIAVDAALGDYQYVERNGARIALGGGGGGQDGVLGVFNIIDGPFNTTGAAVGYTGPTDGSGYMHVIQFDGDACPNAATLLTYSQSSEPSSPHYTDQTRLLAKKQWVTERFCEADIAASPELEVLQVGASFGRCKREGSSLCRQ